jgi:uncharacterized membrane-anchored protein
VSEPQPGHETSTESEPGNQTTSAVIDVSAGSGARGPVHRAGRAITKVPEVTVFFWVIKVLTTGMGEVTSDFLVHGPGPAVAVALGGVALVASLVLQLSVRRYLAWPYWLAVAMVSVFGTMAADVVHIGLGIPYLVSSIFFLAVLTVVFGAWYASEKTLSIHSIHTRRREWFYWATVLATFALGTAAGDMTATTLHLGYFSSGVLFAVLIAVPALAHRRFGMNPILAFWFAYIVTRPLGASFADWVAVPRSRGGLAQGYGTVSLVLTVVILGFVGFLAVTRVDIEDEDARLLSS